MSASIAARAAGARADPQPDRRGPRGLKETTLADDIVHSGTALDKAALLFETEELVKGLKIAGLVLALVAPPFRSAGQSVNLISELDSAATIAIYYAKAQGWYEKQNNLSIEVGKGSGVSRSSRFGRRRVRDRDLATMLVARSKGPMRSR